MRGKRTNERTRATSFFEYPHEEVLFLHGVIYIVEIQNDQFFFWADASMHASAS